VVGVEPLPRGTSLCVCVCVCVVCVRVWVGVACMCVCIVGVRGACGGWVCTSMGVMSVNMCKYATCVCVYACVCVSVQV